jgi:branched-chain amino acid transport system substrate-binding protein
MFYRILLCFLAASIIAAMAQDQPQPRSEPHHDGRNRELQYQGPGREQPEPQDIAEVRIGYFGPSDPDHPAGGDLWLAAQFAVEQANAVGGYSGLPFRLLPAWSEDPWSAGITQVTRLIYSEQVWALIGGIDGPSTHLVQQVTTKARLPLVSGATTDKTVNFAYVPWMFSLLPSDTMQAPVLAQAIASEVTRISAISTTGHDAQLAMVEFQKQLARHGVVIASHIQIPGGVIDLLEPVRQLAKANVRVVLVVADAAESGRIVRHLREEGCGARVFGSATMGRRLFLEIAGPAAEGVIFPLLVEPSDSTFARDFQARFGRLPDYATRQTYDATRLLIDAIGSGGLNRPRIRDAIRALSAWEGSAAGQVEWDAVGQNSRAPRLATVREGVVVALE